MYKDKSSEIERVSIGVHKREIKIPAEKKIVLIKFVEYYSMNKDFYNKRELVSICKE
jgi:hypothetical protein